MCHWPLAEGSLHILDNAAHGVDLLTVHRAKILTDWDNVQPKLSNEDKLGSEIEEHWSGIRGQASELQISDGG